MPYKIIKKRVLAPKVVEFELEAPLIAAKHKAGQFAVFRNDEKGERVPYTIADSDPEKGTLTFVIQAVGKSSADLCYSFEEGDEVLDVIGPLGTPTHVENFGTALCIGGGLGIAPLHPIAKAWKKAGNKIVMILGSRNKELLIMRNRMEAIADEIFYTTDDGSFGRHGFVSEEMARLWDEEYNFDICMAVGPAIMMKVICGLTKKHDLKTFVSLNPVMVDGTGMCGACRCTVGGQTKFVCVDGPEFDGHKVNFEELMSRQKFYAQQEKIALERSPFKEKIL